MQALDRATEADMDRYACSEAYYKVSSALRNCLRTMSKHWRQFRKGYKRELDCADSLQVAMKTVVDNLSVLAVEKCLVEPLPDLLSPQTVVSLDDATVTSIAAETEESKLDRSRASHKLKVLESALIVLRSLDRHKTVGESAFIFPYYFKLLILDLLL